MPIFGGSKRPKLDGLTKDEEKRRDTLNPEVMRRSGEGGVAGQWNASLLVLRERADAEPGEFLWPYILGWQLMNVRRYAAAIDAFVDASGRDASDVRAPYGVAMAYFQAGESRLSLGPAAPPDVAPEGMTVDNLYQESGRYFRRALELTDDKNEASQLREAIGAVDKAVARKAGRL